MLAQNRRRRKKSMLRRLPARSPAAQRAAERRLAWYLGLGLMAVFDVIEWPLAIVIAVGHEIAHRARTEALRELAEGIEAGA